MSKRASTPTRNAQPKNPTNTATREAAPRPPYWWDALLREPAVLLLAVVLLLRPFFDGITFPYLNNLFVIGTVACFGVWVAFQLFRGPNAKAGLHEGLFAALLGVMLLTALNTTQFDGTYRALLNWGSYFLIFIVAANALRNATALGFLLAVFASVALAEALWSLVHLEYVLPMTRAQVMANPNLLRTYFNTDTLTPDLASRLNMNRAFGTFVFPNALGAFMMASALFALGMAVATWHALRGLVLTVKAPSGPATFIDRLGAIVIAVAAGLTTFGAGRFLYWVAYTISYPDQPWTAHPTGWVFFVGILPIAVAMACFITVMLGGLKRGWLRIQLAVLALLFVAASITLWTTASRGAMLAFGASLLLTGYLVYASSHRAGPGGAAGAARAIAILLLATGAVGLLAFAGTALAQSATASASSEAPMAAAAQSAPPEESIMTGGVSPALMSGGTFKLRLTYWRTALDMLANNLVSGVGLGNFGVDYPRYKEPWAGDSKQAHNDFLQMACETGVGGGLLFLAFWAYYLAWGGACIVAERASDKRWIMAGLYAATLGFLIHSLVDFNFSNPSLTTFQYFLAGAFVAVGRGPAGANVRRPGGQVALVAMLLLAMLVAGAALRVYRSDTAFGRDTQHNTLFAVAQFFLEEVNPATFKPDNAPAIAVKDAMTLFPQYDMLSKLGVVHVPIPNGSRPLAKDEPVPSNAFLIVSNPAGARQAARQAIMAWLAHVKQADALYPHNPEVAQHLFNWYQYLATITKDPKEREEYVLGTLEWAEKGVQRNPYLAWFRNFYAMALCMRAELENGPGRMSYYDKGLEQYRLASELAPSDIEIWVRYGDALASYGNGLNNAGDPKRAESYLNEARKAKEHARYLDQEKRKGA